MKICKICCLEKPLIDFHKQPKSKDGRNTDCKKCHHEKIKMMRKDPKNREKFRQYQRRSGMKSRYGITPEIFEEMVIKQENKCLICQNEPVKNGVFQNRNLHIDHCHKSGKVRGLLCHLCNRGIGLFRESKHLLKKAFNYLEHHD